MARINIKQADVQTSLTAALVSGLAIDATRMLEVVDPLRPPDLLPTGDYFVSVSIGEGNFPIDEQGAAQLNENTQVLVTAYTKLRLDNPGSEHELLHHATRGVLFLKKRMLAILAGVDLTTNAGADTFLRDRLLIRHASAPNFDPAPGVGWITITCEVNFDWDLS